MTRRRRSKLDPEWQQMRDRAAAAPHGTTRKRQAELRAYVTKRLQDELNAPPPPKQPDLLDGAA
jgi:hypothetical protein